MQFLQRAHLKNVSKMALLMGGILLLNPSVKAQNEEVKSLKEILGLTGSLRASGFEKNKSYSDDRGHLISGLWLNARPEEFWEISSMFDFRIQGQDWTRSSDTKGDLREAYLERSFGNFDFKVGRQINVWGRADKINPTDVFTARDYTLLVTDDEDQRLGTFSTQAVYNLENFRFIVLWQPEWREPRYPIGELPPGLSIDYGTPKKVNEQFGIKIDHTGSFDWSVSYSHVIDRGPDITPLNAQKLRFDFNTIDVIGADWAYPIGDYGLRAEASYIKTKDGNGNDPYIKNSSIFAVAGVERTFDADLNVNLQYLYRHVFDWRDADSYSNIGERETSRQVNIYSNQIAQNMHGASLRLNYKAFNETLESEVVFVTWFKGSQNLVRPKITYAFSDTFRGIVGYELYSGNEESFFGRLEKLSSGFIEGRWLF